MMKAMLKLSVDDETLQEWGLELNELNDQCVKLMWWLILELMEFTNTEVFAITVIGLAHWVL